MKDVAKRLRSDRINVSDRSPASTWDQKILEEGF